MNVALFYCKCDALSVKVHSHVTSAFVFFFDLCCLADEKANLKCEHKHVLPYNPFVKFDVNANADIACGLGFRNK